MERIGIEAKTIERIGHPAIEVAPTIAERWYTEGQKENIQNGTETPAIIHVPNETSEGDDYEIVLAEAYSAVNAGRQWKGNVLRELQGLVYGTIIVYRRRAGNIPFLVTIGGDNIALRALKQVATKEILTPATKVAQVLGLEPNQTGRLLFVGENRFNFERVTRQA